MDVLDLFAKISMDTSEYTQGLNKAKGFASKSASAISHSFSAVEKAWENVTNVGRTSAKVIAGAMGTMSAAVGAFAKSSVDTGMQFDSSMAQVAATMGTTVDAIQNLRDFAMDMGAKTAFSAKEAADALNYMALAGYSADESMQALPNVLNLAAAGGIDLASASDMVTDAQSALGLSMEESAELVDKMAKASSKSNTSVAQLGEAILTIGGTAKNLAGGTTELSTALGILADNGVKGAEGGTALRNIILSLSAPTDNAAKALASMGIEVYDAAGNMRPLNETFGDLNSALSTMTQGEQTQVLSEIFNKVDLKSVNALLANTGERFDELSGYINNASGAAQAMAETQLDNLAGDVTKLKSALEGAQIIVSDQLAPSLREFVQFGTSGIEKLSTAFQEGGFSGVLDAVSEMISGLLVSFTNAIPQIAGMATDMITSFVSHLGSHTKEIKKAASSIIKTLASGFGKIVDEILPIVSELIPEVVEGILTYQGMLFEIGLDIITAIITGISDNMESITISALGIIERFISSFMENLPILVDAAINIIMSLANFLIENLPLLIESALEIIITLANGISESLPELIPAIVEVIMKIVETLTAPEMLMNLIDAALTLIIALAEGLIKAIPKLLESMPTIVLNIVTALIELAPELLKAALELIAALADGLISNVVELANAAGKMFSTIKETITSRIKEAVTWGKDLIQNFIDGIMAKWNALKEKVQYVAQTVKDFLGFSEPKKGPLSNFHTYAPDMMDLFAKGIAENAKIVQAQLDKSLNFDLGKTSLDFDASITKSAMHSGFAGSTYSMGGVNITINGAQYEDEASLAQRISQELYHMTMRRSSVYATGL